MSELDTPKEAPPRILWGLDDIVAATGIPLTTLRLEMERHPLRGAFLIGRRVCALPSAVHRWLEELAEKNAYTPRKNNRGAA